MLDEGTVFICAGCRRLQRVHGDIQSCTKCGGMTFFTLPELPRVPLATLHLDMNLTRKYDYLPDPKDILTQVRRTRLRTEFPIWTERDKEFLKVTRISPE